MWQHWNFNPALVAAVLGLLAGYYWLGGGRWQARGGCYLAGVALFALAEASPLHYLGAHQLFSAHMVGHIAVLLLAGPLLVLGLPARLPARVSRWAAALSRGLGRHVWLAWGAGVGLMWLLHVPAVFEASFGGGSAALATLPAVAMLAAGALFAWPLFGPLPRYHLHPLVGVGYLFTACVCCSLLGLLITFAPADAYQHYARAAWCGTATLAPDYAANPWHLSAADDQQAAGLIMWVPCCLVYLSGCVLLLVRLFGEEKPAYAGPLGAA